jgi:hypothetical protein
MNEEPLPRPTIERIGDAIRFTWEGSWVVIELDNFDESHGEITAEFMAGSALDDSRVIEWGKLNLSSMHTRTALANNLTKVEPSFDWGGALKQVSVLGARLHREGVVHEDLADHVLSTQPRWYLEPYLERDGFTIAYADGGTGKSVIALALAYTMATGIKVLGRLDAPPAPVLYMDWETSADTQTRRLMAIAKGMGQPMPRNVVYQYMATPLVMQTQNIRAKIAELKIGAIIIDSLGASASGPIEESSTALALGRAIRSFKVPVLAIHHKPKNSDDKRGAQAMFGSVYFANYCRLAWELEGTFYEGQNRTDLSFKNTKNNNGPRVRKHAVTMRFINDAYYNPISIDIAPCDPKATEAPEGKRERPLTERIVGVLIHGPQKAAEIVDQLGASRSAVANILTGMEKEGRALKIAGEKWGLTTNHEPPPF